MRLITIAPSHYCDKVRLALELAQLDYVEQAHLPVFHAPFVRRASGTRTTPVLITPEGALTDSTQILKHLQTLAASAWRPYPEDGPRRAEVERLEDLFDERLGPATRRLAYAHLLPDRDLALSVLRQGAPAWQLKALTLLYPAFAQLLKRGLVLNDQGVRRSLGRVDEVFDEVDALLSDGRAYLVADRLTAADVTFAALAAPVLGPDQYHVRLPAMERLPAPMQALMARYRARAAGRWAMALYAQLRPAP